MPVQELYELRGALENSLKIINKYISQHSAENIHYEQKPVEKTLDLFPTTRTKTRDDPKKISLGACMFVQKKNLTDIYTRDELETCKDRCNKKAFNIKGDVILCSRHKDSDVEKIVEILAGKIKPDEERVSQKKATDPLPEGDYKKTSAEAGSSNDIEDVLDEMGKLEKLLEENRFIPCRVQFRECCIINFKGTTYVVEPSGTCIGKIEDSQAVASFETKAKMKEYFDVQEYLHPLQISDLGFVEYYELYYQTYNSIA